MMRLSTLSIVTLTLSLLSLYTPKAQAEAAKKLDKATGAMPIVRIEPRYPMKAAREGIQGDVILMFTVGKLGQVKDIKVLDSQPKGVFDKAAIKALSKWKYRPMVKEGKPVEQKELVTTLTFRLGS